MKRLQFLKKMASLPLIGASMKLEAFEKISANYSNTKRTPLIFIGHGHPINALLNNDFTQHLNQIGASTEKPNAIMIIWCDFNDLSCKLWMPYWLVFNF